MTHALTLTLKLKQDAATKEKLKKLKENFKTHVQPAMDKALRESKIVHFARVVVIEDKYIQVITEYEGDHDAYTEFFRTRLPEVFKAIFELGEGAPPFEDLNRETFLKISKRLNIQPLGETVSGSTGIGNEPAGYLFSAYGGKTVKQILSKLD